MKNRWNKMNPLIAAATLLALPLPGKATSIVYTPVNPSFGGNPLNGPVLLNSANAQNRFKDPSAGGAGGYSQPSALETFNQRLQSMILNQIANSVTGSIFDANGKLKPGLVDTSAFSVSIVDIGNGTLQITTTDKASGASTTFQVSTTP